MLLLALASALIVGSVGSAGVLPSAGIVHGQTVPAPSFKFLNSSGKAIGQVTGYSNTTADDIHISFRGTSQSVCTITWSPSGKVTGCPPGTTEFDCSWGKGDKEIKECTPVDAPKGSTDFDIKVPTLVGSNTSINFVQWSLKGVPGNKIPAPRGAVEVHFSL